VEFRELAVARLEYRLDLFFGLLRYRNDTIEVLVDEQTNEQLYAMINDRQLKKIDDELFSYIKTYITLVYVDDYQRLARHANKGSI